MTIESTSPMGFLSRASRIAGLAAGLVAALAIASGARAGAASPTCSRTAKLMSKACSNDVADNFYTAKAICNNERKTSDEQSCIDDAKSARDEETQLCQDQQDARLALCVALDENRYDPKIDPNDFVSDFQNPGTADPYQPLGIGDTWDYESATETDHVEVSSDTKQIDGVTCIVVHDQVSEDGILIEDADDWFALAKNGDVWYFGELSEQFEVFDGDEPQIPELVDIEGSFKAGREGAKPGILIPAMPVVGQTYRQEFALGTAEDAATVLATNYHFGDDPTLDELVPADLANALCGDGCVVTKEFSPLEPDDFERKYYAPGIGVFLETDPSTGEVNRLVGCSFDPRCDSL